MEVDPIPPDPILRSRREPKFIIDPRDVSPKDDIRARTWAAAMMKKYEHKLNNNIPDRHIVARGEVEPEDIDVANIYPFANLNWIIYRNKEYFTFLLASNKTVLFVSTFVKI